MRSGLYALFTLALLTTQAYGQCTDRFKRMIFASDTTISNVVYTTSNSTSLKMDIYMPKGDTAAVRPLLILAHGGSFTGGTKTQDPVIITLCHNFAKRGYVTVSIDYRLAASPLDMLDSAKAIDVVLKALSDGKSAIRYLRKDAYTNNFYRIDTNHIFVGGNSAGAVLYEHAIYLDSVAEAPVYLQNTINANGGFEGNSGNDGYSSEVHALLSLAGGMNKASFVGPGSKPSYNAQGDQDPVVPYYCAHPNIGTSSLPFNVPVTLCGLGSLEPYYLQYNVYHRSDIFPGDGHVPWQGDAAKMTMVDTNAANFLYTVLCGFGTGINTISSDDNVKVFPNPATNRLNVSFTDITDYKKVQLFNNLGQMIEEKTITTPTVYFERNNLPSAIYFTRIVKKDNSVITRKVVFE